MISLRSTLCQWSILNDRLNAYHRPGVHVQKRCANGLWGCQEGTAMGFFLCIVERKGWISSGSIEKMKHVASENILERTQFEYYFFKNAQHYNNQSTFIPVNE